MDQVEDEGFGSVVAYLLARDSSEAAKSFSKFGGPSLRAGRRAIGPGVFLHGSPVLESRSSSR